MISKMIKFIKRAVKSYSRICYDNMRMTGDAWIRPAIG